MAGTSCHPCVGMARTGPLMAQQSALPLTNHSPLLQVDDMCQFGSVARAAHADQGLPACPWFLAGFSLGGLTAAHVALREQEQWQGLVLVAGCMWVRMTLVTQ